MSKLKVSTFLTLDGVMQAPATQAAEVPTLKEQHDLLVMGSGRLVHALREHDLVDEYEIWIHPILLGAGGRLFEQSTDVTTLALTGTTTTDKGVTVLTYEVTH